MPRLWLIGLLFVLALAPRLAMIAARPDSIEAWEYDTLAQNLVAGDGYVIPRFGHLSVAFGDGNLYSFAAASIYLIVGHNMLILAVVQAVVASLAIPVIFFIGQRAFGARVALLAAILTAFHPGLLVYTLKLHPLGMDVLLLGLVVLWIGRTGHGLSNGLATGLTLGLSLMSRPTFFVAGIVALIARWRTCRASLVPVAAAVLVALALAAPWVGRNWMLLGRPVLISSSMEDIWKGNNAAASGSSHLPSGQDIFSAAPDELQAQFYAVDELQLNAVFTSEVVGFMTQHPTDFALLTARKFVYFWWLAPQTGLFYPSSWLPAYQLYAFVVLTLAAIGALAIVRGGNSEERNLLGIVAWISLTVAVVHALAYVEGRHRWGIEPLLLLLTARGAFVVARGFRLSRLLPISHVARDRAQLPR